MSPCRADPGPRVPRAVVDATVVVGRAVPTALMLAASLALSACVTERPPRPGSMLESTRAAVAAGSSPASSVALPGGPVARPVPADLTTSARLNFRIQPMGSVEYDGLVLPLVSPDGRFLAVEQGDPPGWSAVLALPDAAPAVSTSIVVYDLASGGAGTPLKEVAFAEGVPRGSVLGRSCDTKGFLVELPRPDGSRWIGRVAWLTGKTTWLAQGEAVNAHAVVTASGLLAFTRRAVGTAAVSSLVLQSPDGLQRVIGAENVAESAGGAERSYLFPMFGPDGSTLNVLSMTDNTLELTTIRVHESPRGAEFGSVLARQQIAREADAALAYQIVAPAQTTLLGKIEGDGVATDEAPARGVVVYHPALGRTAEFDWRRGVFVPLAPGSIAAASSPFVEPGGYFATTPDGLTFMPFPPERAQAGSGRGPLGRVMDVAYVARATRDASRALILLGPGGKAGLPRIAVMGVSFPRPEVEPAMESAQSRSGE